jgi:beta-glucanase (GH16 family)
MVAFWLSGIEDTPEHSGEICVMEVFGDAPADIGMGLKTIRDPAVPQDFETVPLPIDLRDFHTYAVEWTGGEATFFVDGAAIRSCQGAPTYPLQLMLAVFDFPERSGPEHVPTFTVDSIRGWNVAEALVA